MDIHGVLLVSTHYVQVYSLMYYILDKFKVGLRLSFYYCYSIGYSHIYMIRASFHSTLSTFSDIKTLPPPHF